VSRPKNHSISEQIEPSQSTGPRAADVSDLYFPEPLANLGDRKGIIEHRFAFRNRSHHRIRIDNINPSCSCTLVEPDRKEIGPDEEGSFGIKVDLNKQTRGFKRFQIDVRYTSDQPHHTWLELVLVNQPDVQVLPSEIRTSAIVGETVTSRFTLIDFREHPLDITALRSSLANLEARIVSKPDAYASGWKYTLEVTAKTGGMEPGRYLETIELDCEPAPPRPLSATVDLNVLPRVYFRPPIVFLDKKDVIAENTGKFIELADHLGNGAEIEIDQASCTIPHVKLTVERAQPARGPRVHIGWKEATAAVPEGPVKIIIQVKRPCTQKLVAYFSFR